MKKEKKNPQFETTIWTIMGHVTRRYLAMIATIGTFILLQYLGICLGQTQPHLIQYLWFLCFIMFMMVFFLGPAYLTVALLKVISLKQTQIVRYMVMAVLIIPVVHDYFDVVKDMTREVNCYTKESQQMLSGLINNTKNFFNDIEKKLHEYGANLTENEGMMIEKILERFQGLVEVKNDVGKMVDRLKNMEEVCKKKLESLTEKACKTGLTLVDEHVEKQKDIVEFFWRFGRRLVEKAVNASCEKMESKMNENNPCSMHRKLLRKMKKVAKEETRETAEGMESEEPDAFDVEIEKEFAYTITSHFDMKLGERIKKHVDNIVSLLGILLSIKGAVFVLAIPMICMSTISTIKKFKRDPSYSNRTVSALAEFIDKEEQRRVLPLRPQETGNYTMSIISFNFTVIKRNLSTIITLLLPMSLEVIFLTQIKVGEPILVPREVFESEDFSACYGKEKERESTFSWIFYGIVLAAYTGSVLLESFFGSNLEIALLELHYPAYKKLRALWLLDDIVAYRRQYVEPTKYFYQDSLEKFIARIPWPHTECFQCQRYIYWKRNYCKNALCSVLLCSTCITKPCLNCQRLKKIDRAEDKYWWNVKKK